MLWTSSNIWQSVAFQENLTSMENLGISSLEYDNWSKLIARNEYVWLTHIACSHGRWNAEDALVAKKVASHILYFGQERNMLCLFLRRL